VTKTVEGRLSDIFAFENEKYNSNENYLQHKNHSGCTRLLTEHTLTLLRLISGIKNSSLEKNQSNLVLAVDLRCVPVCSDG